MKWSGADAVVPRMTVTKLIRALIPTGIMSGISASPATASRRHRVRAAASGRVGVWVCVGASVRPRSPSAAGPTAAAMPMLVTVKQFRYVRYLR